MIGASGPAYPVPAWIEEEWTSARPQVEASYRDWLGVNAATFEVTARYDASEAENLNINAWAREGRVHLNFLGDRWQNSTTQAKRMVQQNLAHEIAHQWQFSEGDTDLEPIWWHEGTAEAMALKALADSRLWSMGTQITWQRDAELRCARALKRGALADQFEAGDREAVYGCGFILTSAIEKRSELDLPGLRRSYLSGTAEGLTFMAFVEQVAGRDMERSVEAFISRDHSHADGQWVIDALRAGRL